MSAKKRDSQKVGWTGPIMHARPPSLTTRYASLRPASTAWPSSSRCSGFRADKLQTLHLVGLLMQ